jgi:hypothetical protein
MSCIIQSGVGSKVRLIASTTFPTGIDLTSFVADQDPITVDINEISTSEFGVNGDQINTPRGNSIVVTIRLIANSEDDTSMKYLGNANRAAKNKIIAADCITMIISYPDGHTETLTKGVLNSFMPSRGVQQDGGFQDGEYGFSFENIQYSD